MKNRIKEFRENASLTQIDLGKMIDVSRQPVTSISI